MTAKSRLKALTWLLGCFLGAITLVASASSPQGLKPSFSGKDRERPRITVGLQEVLTGLSEPTDFVVLPDGRFLVTEKAGLLRWGKSAQRAKGGLLELKVRTRSELGLLGIALHPEFATNQKIYLNSNPDDSGPMRTRISEWTLPDGADTGFLPAKSERVLLEFEQPYANHNGGQLVFGPDGFLYIGTGDGGSGGDPHEHGQNLKSLLGKILRIDVRPSPEGKPYRIPESNPFLKDQGARPEIWAYGLRNPWRFTFDSKKRLLAADVGQSSWEEVSVVPSGGNMGWNIKEGSHCFRPKANCDRPNLISPVLEYDRQDGQSITGGMEYQGRKLPALSGKYVFGDFGSGRLWAADLSSWKLFALGAWPILPSAFARDSAGEIYVADYENGKIFQLIAVSE